GSALVARLAQSVFAANIPLHLNAPATKLLRDQCGCVNGVEFMYDGQARQIHAHRGVVLASGGFPGSYDRRRTEIADPDAPHISMAGQSSTGDGAAMAEAIGAKRGPAASSAFFRCPVSVHTPAGKAPRPFAHLTLDRAKPGVIAVDRT